MYTKIYFFSKLALCLVLSLFISAEILAAESSPAVKPSGWVANEIDGDLRGYLRSQYLESKDRGLTPYVYVYSDRSRHCRSIRAMMKRDDMKDAFNGTHIVMLNYFDVRKRNGSKSKASEFTPSIVRISEDGRLIGKEMNPELYLYYPSLTKEPDLRRYTIKHKWSGPVPKGAFARQLKKYFEANNGA